MSPPPGSNHAIRYRHTQPGYLMIYIFSAIALSAAVFLMIFSRRARNPAEFIALSVCAACLPVFHSLTVSIDDRALEASFGIGLLCFRFPLEDIVSAAPVSNHWWYGWGIHGWPGRGWLYNVSGSQAVELRMRNGTRNRIGTDEPAQLAQAIRQAIAADGN